MKRCQGDSIIPILLAMTLRLREVKDILQLVCGRTQNQVGLTSKGMLLPFIYWGRLFMGVGTLCLWGCALRMENTHVQVHVRSDERLGKGTRCVSFFCALKTSCPTFPASKGRGKTNNYGLCHMLTQSSWVPACLNSWPNVKRWCMDGGTGYFRGFLWKANSSFQWLLVGRGN